jgi:hypothetical protein
MLACASKGAENTVMPMVAKTDGGIDPTRTWLSLAEFCDAFEPPRPQAAPNKTVRTTTATTGAQLVESDANGVG